MARKQPETMREPAAWSTGKHDSLQKRLRKAHGYGHLVSEEEELLAKTVFREDSCKSCELCLAVCPQKIIYITDRINRQGYRPAGTRQADMQRCLGCAVCARICPDAVIEVYQDAE